MITVKHFWLWLCLLLTLPSAAQAAERVDRFHLDYTINQDTSLTVQEQIDYYTSVAKHGIFRYLPQTYTNRAATPVEVIQVTLGDGQTHPYTTSSENNKKIIKIGDANRTFTGNRQYQLTYQVKYALTKTEAGTAELYWDLVGEDWDFAINNIQATIHSPFASVISAECWSGQFGGDDGLCQTQVIDSQTVSVSYPHPITKGGNVTVSVKLQDDGQLTWPSWWQQNSTAIITFGLLAIAIISLAILNFYLIMSDRDHIFINDQQLTLKPTGQTKVRPWFYKIPDAFWYEPFTNISPAQAGMLIDNTFNSQHLIAEIIALVEKKYLKIDPVNKNMFTGQDYIFTQLKAPSDKLPTYQRQILTKIFTRRTSVKLSQLKKDFFTQIPKIKTTIKSSLFVANFYRQINYSPAQWRFGLILLAGLISIVLLISRLSGGAMFVLFILFFLIEALMAYLLRHYHLTALGNHYRYLIAGFKKNVQLGKWRTEIQEKQLYVEKVLPFAIALGVADKLAQDMKELGLDQTNQGTATTALIGTSLLSSGFVDSFSHDFGSVYASQTSSGGSSSSGGGSSGGGGGGGGGGSW
jgi:uncharacterized membrane protein